MVVILIWSVCVWVYVCVCGGAAGELALCSQDLSRHSQLHSRTWSPEHRLSGRVSQTQRGRERERERERERQRGEKQRGTKHRETGTALKLPQHCLTWEKLSLFCLPVSIHTRGSLSLQRQRAGDSKDFWFVSSDKRHYGGGCSARLRVPGARTCTAQSTGGVSINKYSYMRKVWLLLYVLSTPFHRGHFPHSLTFGNNFLFLSSKVSYQLMLYLWLYI